MLRYTCDLCPTDYVVSQNKRTLVTQEKAIGMACIHAKIYGHPVKVIEGVLTVAKININGDYPEEIAEMS